MLRPPMRPVVRPVLRDVMSPSHISDSIKYALFSSGEQGAYYDLYDQSTLFQDAAGTTPWTAYGQPLGLQLDKSKGLVLGPERMPSLNFQSGWGTSNATVSSASAFVVSPAPGGVYTSSGIFDTGRNFSITVSFTASGSTTLELRNGTTGASPLISSATGASGTITAILVSAASVHLYFRSTAAVTVTITSISVRELPGNHRYQTTPTARPTIEARVNRFVGTETLATQNVTTVAGGYILRFTGTGTVTLSGTAVGAYSAGTHSITCTAGTLTATVAGTVTQADLRLSLDSAYPYQRVTTATDYADIGAPPRIKYDGIDDFLQTASVNFSATDKMTVWAGVRKLSDAAQAVICELSTNATTTNGAFVLSAPASAAANFSFASRGTALSTQTTAGHAAPISRVLTGVGNIAGDVATLSVNAVSATSSTDQGTGNYSTNPLYFGSRAGTSLRFSGEVFSPEVIRGAESNAAQIDMVERIINRNMGGVY